jgi:hypothetical protein
MLATVWPQNHQDSGAKKTAFDLCVFSATPLLPSIVDNENHIFLAVLSRPA